LLNFEEYSRRMAQQSIVYVPSPISLYWITAIVAVLLTPADASGSLAPGEMPLSSEAAWVGRHGHVCGLSTAPLASLPTGGYLP
jgi:hypothetical protein